MGIMQTLETPKTPKIISQPDFDTTIHRRKTRPVKVGNITIGGGFPVVVQSMINEDTLDIEGSVAAIRRLHEIGCEIVRVTVPSMGHAKALATSKEEFEKIGDKIRQTLEPLVISLRDQGKAMRIGVNHGSLAERMLFTYGDTPEGMVESALEFIHICESLDFYNLIVSLKASRVPVMLAAYRLMVKRMDELGMDYPLHLGVTEAG